MERAKFYNRLPPQWRNPGPAQAKTEYQNFTTLINQCGNIKNTFRRDKPVINIKVEEKGIWLETRRNKLYHVYTRMIYALCFFFFPSKIASHFFPFYSLGFCGGRDWIFHWRIARVPQKHFPSPLNRGSAEERERKRLPMRGETGAETYPDSKTRKPNLPGGGRDIPPGKKMQTFPSRISGQCLQVKKKKGRWTVCYAFSPTMSTNLIGTLSDFHTLHEIFMVFFSHLHNEGPAHLGGGGDGVGGGRKSRWRERKYFSHRVPEMDFPKVFSSVWKQERGKNIFAFCFTFRILS